MKQIQQIYFQKEVLLKFFCSNNRRLLIKDVSKETQTDYVPIRYVLLIPATPVQLQHRIQDPHRRPNIFPNHHRYDRWLYQHGLKHPQQEHHQL